jgi:hypothetical protein
VNIAVTDTTKRTHLVGLVKKMDKRGNRDATSVTDPVPYLELEPHGSTMERNFVLASCGKAIERVRANVQGQMV